MKNKCTMILSLALTRNSAQRKLAVFTSADRKEGTQKGRTPAFPFYAHGCVTPTARKEPRRRRIFDSLSHPAEVRAREQTSRGRPPSRHPSGPAATPVAATATSVATTVTPAAGRAGNHRRSPQTTVQTHVWPSSDARRCYRDARRHHRDARCGSSR
ncbi:hypothetical protein JYU34_010137 [Plutella xylostella]|uniref:Uncharacterized protein n=1 Tax=Plutella xylostella TaxID=51655 RepID=A0ABQ7QHV4_PLUXY|nr:hypothetical protein JYU34_010137 [Plutella xylostella]